MSVGTKLEHIEQVVTELHIGQIRLEDKLSFHLNPELPCVKLTRHKEDTKLHPVLTWPKVVMVAGGLVILLLGVLELVSKVL
jgi:hypothetical protein